MIKFNYQIYKNVKLYNIWFFFKHFQQSKYYHLNFQTCDSEILRLKKKKAEKHFKSITKCVFQIEQTTQPPLKVLPKINIDQGKSL
jgi:hypothetical protein